MMHRMSGLTELAEKITTGRIYIKKMQHIIKSLKLSKDVDSSVYKLITDKLQLVLINMLLDQFLNIKVSQSNVETHLSLLRRNGILNYQSLSNQC